MPVLNGLYDINILIHWNTSKKKCYIATRNVQVQLMSFYYINIETIGKLINIYFFQIWKKCTSPANEFLLHECRNKNKKMIFFSNPKNVKIYSWKIHTTNIWLIVNHWPTRIYPKCTCRNNWRICLIFSRPTSMPIVKKLML